jgi:CheY-like chemotaxis protein
MAMASQDDLPPLALLHEKFWFLGSMAWSKCHTRALCSLLYISPGTKPRLLLDVFGWAAGGITALEEPLVILVIEDDEAIQGIVEDALTEGGFGPAIAASGEEAVTLLKGGLTKYRALVTDISLRGRMDGWEVAKQAREIDPAFPIIYITAAHADQWASQGVPNSVLLTKPFAPAQLVTAVSQLLNSGTPTT